MNMLSNMDEIANIIIRPNRYLYKVVDLGPKVINYGNDMIYHYDFEIKNNQKLMLKASLYTLHQDIKQIKSVLIYLHCNSGCRIQGLAYMKMAIANGFSYVIFDFAGSGLSQGKYVSLGNYFVMKGYYQAEDIKCVIKSLKAKINTNIRIVLWGRSMGAVAALKYLSSNKGESDVIVSVFDSPFQSLKQLFLEIGRQKTNLPKLVLEVALKYLKPIVETKAKFNIDHVSLEGLDQIIGCPGIFIASKKDTLIPFWQMDAIFKEYKSPKEMLFVEESHNQPRNGQVIKQVFVTIQKFIESVESKATQFQSELPIKNPSKKKLQLTIKSFSQKNLAMQCKSSQTPRGGGLKQISFPVLERRYISCLFEKQKKCKNLISLNLLSEEPQSQSNSINLKHKKKQLTIRRFFKDENQEPFEKPNLFRFKSQKECGSSSLNIKTRDQERKTMQHIANKKPPFIDGNKLHEFRNSLQFKYRTQFGK